MAVDRHPGGRSDWLCTGREWRIRIEHCSVYGRHRAPWFGRLHICFALDRTWQVPTKTNDTDASDDRYWNTYEANVNYFL